MPLSLWRGAIEDRAKGLDHVTCTCGWTIRKSANAQATRLYETTKRAGGEERWISNSDDERMDRFDGDARKCQIMAGDSLLDATDRKGHWWTRMSITRYVMISGSRIGPGVGILAVQDGYFATYR